MSLHLTDDRSTVAHVKVWCRQATGHCPSQCWPTFISPYNISHDFIWFYPYHSACLTCIGRTIKYNFCAYIYVSILLLISNGNQSQQVGLTHWGRVTHICVSKLTIIASDNGLSPGRRQATIFNNAGILSIGPLGTKFSEILIEILTFSFTKMSLKVSSAKWRPFCLGLNVLTWH